MRNPKLTEVFVFRLDEAPVREPRKTFVVKNREDWVCPVHALPVEKKTKLKKSGTSGLTRFKGNYYGCPKYAEWGYYVSGPNGRGEYVAPVIDEYPEGFSGTSAGQRNTR